MHSLTGSGRLMTVTVMKRRQIVMMKVLSGLVALALFVFVLFPAGAEAGATKNMLALFLNRGVMTVGTDIPQEDITEFYFTLDSSTNPPYFQRYRFYVENGGHWFYHEKREGRHWPLTKADITVSGSVELSDEQWAKFFDLIKGGKVEKRKEHTESGGRGPWLFLYWKGDRSKYQEFSFPSWGARDAFEKYCIALKDAQKS